jgi:hypothetical protein
VTEEGYFASLIARKTWQKYFVRGVDSSAKPSNLSCFKRLSAFLIRALLKQELRDDLQATQQITTPQ